MSDSSPHIRRLFGRSAEGNAAGSIAHHDDERKNYQAAGSIAHHDDERKNYQAARVKKPGELRIEQADPRKLNPAAYNPRKITAKKMELLRRSIAKFGFVDPAQVQRKGDRIIGGHQRIAAAILENLKTVPVVRLDITDDQAKLLNLALNAEYGTVDVPKLSFLLKELKIAGAEMELTGYTAQEIDELTSDAAAVFEEVDLRPPPTIVWILLGIPFEQFGKARDAVAALQELSAISVQSNRD